MHLYIIFLLYRKMQYTTQQSFRRLAPKYALQHVAAPTHSFHLKKDC